MLLNATEHERLLIVRINHLAERLAAYTDQPIATYAAMLYAPTGQLLPGHVRAVADWLNAGLPLPLPDEALPLRRQIFDALSSLQTSIAPPAPPPPPMPPAPPAPPMPTPRPPRRRSGIRKAAASIRGSVVNKCRQQETPTPGAMHTTAGLLACAPLPPRP